MNRDICLINFNEFEGPFADCLSVILAVPISTETDVEHCVLKSMRVKLISVHFKYDRKKEELDLFSPLKEVGLDRFFKVINSLLL